ncbi:hypothetical protein [Mesobacillus stamsii]|uniref:Sigma-70 family RNA polymerase sigma factor n=1 Tax=Mesobacillus stamsii TaxID=225347 RepID=A0ABU0FR89_9BACI|nr:hypothetical protein [Mesobacillus stamsii]MDQ0411879.1 hypothetical protein [Mesobacillus stamsii]
MTMRPASVFIMDVSNSSSVENGETLSNYIGQLESTVKKWYGNSGSIQVHHRAGDELIFLAEGYSTAFITAFYISRIWKFQQNAPYFGLSFGNIEKSIEAIEIEKWIHPIVKQARIANEHLKKQKDRESFFFLTDGRQPEHQILMNGMLSLQNVLITHQTDIQRLVCSLYLIYGKQKAVADILGRSAPTVYSHFKKGHSEQVLKSFQDIVSVLESLQRRNYADSENSVEVKIKDDIKSQLREVFSL